MLIQALRSLCLPPGDMVYHLVVLFAIDAIVLMTWRRAARHTGQTRRWAMGAWGLAAGRALLVLAAMLASARWIPSAATILPPLERCVEVVSLALLAWTFLPAAERYARVSHVLVVGNLALAVVVYAWAAPQWFILSQQGIYYNGTAQDVMWGIWALGLAIVSIAAALSYRQSGWAIGLIAFAIMAAGHALHLVQADSQLNVSEWARVAGLAAYPLFATLVVGLLPTPDPSTLARPAPATLDLWPIAEAGRAVAEGAGQHTLGRSAEAIAHAIHADLVVIGLPGVAPDTVELTGIYCADGTPQATPSFSLDSVPALWQVISRKTATRVPIDQALPLTTALELTPRPLLIQPLVHHRETLGVLIASQLERGLEGVNDNGFARAAQAAADHLAFALGTARKTELIARRAEQLTLSLRDQETQQAQMRAALEAQAAQARADLQSALVQVSQAQQQSAHHQKRAAEIAALVELQTSAPADWQEQARQLYAESARAEAETQKQRQQVEQLRQRQAELEIELAQAIEQTLHLTNSSASKIEPVSRLALDGKNLGMLITDSTYQVQEASPTAVQLLGLSREALIGQPLSQVLADPSWAQMIQSITHPNGSPLDVPVRFDTQNGSGPLHIQLTPLESESTPDGLVVIVTRVNDPHPDPGSREVIASLTQELRTPMTSISGYTDLLLGETPGILGAMQRQFLQRVKANIERMNEMLNDLIRITAIDAHDLKLEPEPINLVQVIENAIVGSSAQFRERSISVRLDLAEHLPPVHADRDSLYQIMSHLLANACLCSQPGTNVTISAQQTEDDKYLSVSITDTGGGISPTDQPRVFARRYRADNPLVEGLGDTGVGLSIVKTLVEAHHGRIWVRSDMGHGSTFTFLLQAAHPAEVSS